MKVRAGVFLTMNAKSYLGIVSALPLLKERDAKKGQRAKTRTLIEPLSL
jgi:hypothetical protein